MTTTNHLPLAAGLLIAGEAAAFAVPRVADAWGWLVVLALPLLLAGYGWAVRWTGWGALFVLGAVLAFRTETRLEDALSVWAGDASWRNPVPLVVEGEVHVVNGGTDRARTPAAHPDHHNRPLHVDFEAHLGPMPLKVVVPVAAGDPLPAPGETWAVSGRLSHREDRLNRYARRTLWVPVPTGACRRACARGVTARAVWQARTRACSGCAGVGLEWSSELAGLNRAILLGRRDGLSRAQRQVFVDAGTIHVFAISGLHVVIVAWFLRALLMRLDLASRAAGLVALPLVWGYVVLTGAHASAVRAALMASLCLLAPVLGRRPDLLSAWSITALVVYGLNPERLFDVGCSLSFAVMFGIAVWLRWSRPLASPFEAYGWWARRAAAFGVSFAAWVAGAPIAAHVFGRFTPGGLLANIIVMECAQPMMKCSVGALAASGFCLPLAGVLNNVAALFIWVMVTVSAWVAALPFSSFDVARWSYLQCAAWYAGWSVALVVLGRVLPRRVHEPKKWW